MLVREMSQQECESLLRRVGRLAFAIISLILCRSTSRPEPGGFYGFATMGQKIEWLRFVILWCAWRSMRS